MANMAKFFQKLNLGNIRTILREVVVRFPMATLLVLAITGILIYLTAFDKNLDMHTRTILIKIIITNIVAFFFSLSMSLFGESEKFLSSRPYIAQILVMLFAVFFYVTLDGYVFESVEPAAYTLLTLSGFVSLLFVAPFFRKILTRKYDQDVYYVYFYRTSLVFLISAIVGGTLLFLGSIAIGSVFALFDLAMLDKRKVFMYWTIFALAFFAPLFALAHVPKKETFITSDLTESKFFTFLIKYIGVPFIYVYFLILYVYSIKVLMNFSDWPKGHISWMVIIFSIFGYMMYIFTYLLREQNSLIRLFRKLFPVAVIPQVLMLFYAIYLRIYQYDITMNRYFIVVFGTWLLGVSLYYALSKQKYLGIIPFSLGIIILIISMGPWSVYSMPAERQYNKLVRNLEQAHILKDGVIVPLAKYTDIDGTLSNEIHNGINYMCDFSECSRIKKLFATQLAGKEKLSREEFEKNIKVETLGLKDATNQEHSTYPGLTTWEIVQSVADEIKVRKDQYNDTSIRKYITFHTSYDLDYFPIQLDNYQYIANIYGNSSMSQPSEDLWVSIDSIKKELIVHKQDTVLETIQLPEVWEKLMNQSNGTNDVMLPKEALMFQIKGVKSEIKLLIKSINIENPQYIKGSNIDAEYTGNSSGYALIKIK